MCQIFFTCDWYRALIDNNDNNMKWVPMTALDNCKNLFKKFWTFLKEWRIFFKCKNKKNQTNLNLKTATATATFYENKQEKNSSDFITFDMKKKMRRKWTHAFIQKSELYTNPPLSTVTITYIHRDVRATNQSWI